MKKQKRPTSRRPGEELRLDAQGVVDKKELFFMRIGTLRLRQRWIDREISPSLTGAVALGIAIGGFALGVLSTRLFPSWCCGCVAGMAS